MKRTMTLLSTLVAGTLSTQAAITIVHTYDLGEASTVIGGVPQDSTGTTHFTNGIGGGMSVNTVGVGASGSTAYASLSNQGVYGADFSGFATDNFGIELWARTSDSDSIIFTTGNSGQFLDFQTTGGNWAASINGASWVGGNNGAGQAFTANTWTHLALIRNNGTTTFYINGVAQSGTSNAAVTHSAGHLGVRPGDGRRYEGDIDSVRMFTFDPINDDPVAALNTTAVPEPTSTALLGLGGVALLLRRRK
ncbi:LamG domain-containing protein [Rubritalea tangerina]|uniref:LamG domain-containing protein n=2 Tax=Rubritalea tangerina TaxID=430798 RepID=A0ABW4ZB56_9BACT